MSSLRNLQEHFAEAMLDPGSAGSELNIRANGLDGARRLCIYRNNIVNSFTEALRACYPVVDRLVGGRFFNHTAQAYLRAYPSRSGDLREYGSAFAQFLEGFAPAKALAYLPDVARLEWARQLVYHAAEATPLQPSALGAIAPERHAELRFLLNPAARLVASPYRGRRLRLAEAQRGTGLVVVGGGACRVPGGVAQPHLRPARLVLGLPRFRSGTRLITGGELRSREPTEAPFSAPSLSAVTDSVRL